MKIVELIKHLAEILDMDGNVEVFICEEGIKDCVIISDLVVGRKRVVITGMDLP